MKRFLSWVVLCVLSVIASIIMGIASDGLRLICDWILSLNGIVEVVVHWFANCFLGSVDFLLPLFLSLYVISLCEKIHESKKGIRYIVCGAYAILCLILQRIFSGRITLPYIMFAVYGATMIVWTVKKKYKKG